MRSGRPASSWVGRCASIISSGAAWRTYSPVRQVVGPMRRSDGETTYRLGPSSVGERIESRRGHLKPGVLAGHAAFEPDAIDLRTR